MSEMPQTAFKDSVITINQMIHLVSPLLSPIRG